MFFVINEFRQEEFKISQNSSKLSTKFKTTKKKHFFVFKRYQLKFN